MPIINLLQCCQENELCQFATEVLEKARKQGATAAEVELGVGTFFSLNVRNGELETIEKNNGKGLGITVYFDKRIGSAETSDFNPEAINQTLEKACNFAKFVNEDPYVGLADPTLMAKNFPDLDLYHPWDIEIDEGIMMAKNCEKQGFLFDKRIINSDGARINSSQSFSIYANSHGFLGKSFHTKHSLSCHFIAEEKSKMQCDSYYTIARDKNDLESMQNVANKAASRAVNRLNAKHISTRHCPVIFLAEVAGSLLHDFVNAIYGDNLYRNSSFLLNHLGKQIFPEFINIEERPHVSKALGSTAFDAEGVGTKRSMIVKNGILERYVLDSYAARKLQLETTGNAGGITNVFINTGKLDLPQLIKEMNRGFLVTDLLGDSVNLLTGDYSRGVFGFWIENGEIQYPVEGATIAGNLQGMFRNIIAIANDVDHRSSILTGSVLIDRMTIAGD